MPFSESVSSLKSRVKANPILFVVLFVVTLGVFGSGLKYLEENARQQKALKPKDRSALSGINPFLAVPTPEPTPQLSKEYIYAGSRLLAVEDANANAAPPADLAVWRPSNGNWYVLGGTGSAQVTQEWGVDGDKPVPGDYDGDGKTDFSVLRKDDPSSGNTRWYIMYSSDNSLNSVTWGLNDDKPAAADYDGDGKTDRGVWRPSNQNWYITYSHNNSNDTINYGSSGDIPAPADYDGDGKADLGIWRTSNRKFYSANSSDAQSHIIDTSFNPSSPDWGVVSGDYDGDGKADYAVYNQAAGTWHIRSSITGDFPGSPVTWGIADDIPVPNDYDGDGLCDIAVWRPHNSSGNTDVGHWYIRQSASGNSTRDVQWGIAGDIPVPAYYRR